MSADNWAYCPQCKKKAEADHAADMATVESQYGKITPDEFMRKMNALNKVTVLQDSLREDYELGISKDGIFRVSYRAHCSVCGFTFSHKHEQEARP